MNEVDVVIIGAGASGLMCAAAAGRRGRRVVVLDSEKQAGRKILMSGGGRCNFTNYDVEAWHFISANPHFCKSALKRYSQWDVINLLQKHGVAYAERDHGQLFCVESAKQVLDLLLRECREAGVSIRLGEKLASVERVDDGRFVVQGSKGTFCCQSLVVATGGLSIPSAGASPFGYRLAEQFGVAVRATCPGLVPLTLQPADKKRLAPLSGIAIYAEISVAETSFRENVLFTHRGLSGPVILQISSYWQAGQTLTVNLLPAEDVAAVLQQSAQQQPKNHVRTVLAHYLPRRVVDTFVPEPLCHKAVGQLTVAEIAKIEGHIQNWQVAPNGTEGYRTAEVTLGGIDCDELSSKTFEARKVDGLYFIGEVVDVAGWLGGYNLQWAWSSGWCAGQYV